MEKRFVIFGCGIRGKRFYGKLSPENEIIGFSDNNAALWGTELFGKPVIPPERLKELEPLMVIICVALGFHQIEEQLERMGVSHTTEEKYLNDLFRREFRKAMEEAAGSEWTESAVKKAESGGKYLLICSGGYPSEKNPNRFRFVHDRVLQYQKAGVNVEVFSMKVSSEDEEYTEYTYEGVRVRQGETQKLVNVLQSTQFAGLLIHFVIQSVMYAIYQAKMLSIPTVIWCHGYEVLPWYRCWFNYSEEECRTMYRELENSDDEKSDFLRQIFAMRNIHFVFVSDWELERTIKFVGNAPVNFSVIHNYVDCDFFALPEKRSEDRLRILSIKNHGTRMYANDLTAKAIMELSKRSWFPSVTFELYGKGGYFEYNYWQLLDRNFPNVHIHETFVDHDEMRKLFAENGIFLSPTRNDTQGVSTCEAMAAGMAVVTSAAGAVTEFVDEDCGSIFEYDNYWMMAEEIEYLVFHSDEFLRKGQNAVRRIRNQCGYQATIEKELRLIRGDVPG